MDLFVSILTTAGLIIIGILLFELIIFFHEGGHFLCAKLSGVKVNEFALGMGPKLFSFKKGETTYSLRLLPIGGFCAMEGEDEESDNPRAFNNAKIYKRMIIVVAGAVMNIVLGLIFMGIILLPGEDFATPTVAMFSPKAYSANCGLEVGDTITSFNGYKVNNSMDLSYACTKLKVQDVDGDSLQIYKQDAANTLCTVYTNLSLDGRFEDLSEAQLESFYNDLIDYVDRVNVADSKESVDKLLSEFSFVLTEYFPEDTPVIPTIVVKETRPRFRADLVVIRDGEKVQVDDVDFYTFTTADDDTPQMSIDFYTEAKDKTPLTFVGEVGSQTVSVVRMVFDSLIGLIQGEFSFGEVSGPIGATSATVEVAKEGLKSGFGTAVLNIVYIMMVISVNLGVVNMLPFPALDGGRFVMLLIEVIFRKPVPRKVEGYINAVGLGLLLLLMLVISVKDIWQLFV